MSTMSEILASTRKLIEVKKAEFNSTLKKADDKALNNTGAGDDSPITRGHALDATQSALEPTKKPLITSDAMTAQPPSDGKGTKADLKGKNEGNVTDRADKLEAGDSVLEPKKEPLITSDANANPEAGASGQTAKQATAKLANEILTDIRAYQQKRATAPQAEAKPAPKAEPTPTEKAAAMPAQLAAALAKKEGPEPKAEDKKEEKKEDKKEASGPQLELTTDVLAKIASIVLSSEEGAEFVEGQLAKAAGAEAAQETLAFLAEQSELAEKQAAFEQGQADAEALIQQAVYQAGREAGHKEAAAAQQNKLMAGLGQKVAQAGIEEMMGQGAGAMEGGAPGPDVGAAELAGGAAGGMPGAEGGAGEQITEEDLMMALQALVQEGTIKPEEAQAVVEALTGGGEGGAAAGGAAGGMPEGMPGAEAAPASAAAPAAEEGKAGEKKEEKAEAKEEKEEKESSVQKKASALLDAIRQVRASRK